MKINEELLNFLNASPTAFHAVAYIRSLLKKNGYEEMNRL